MLVLDALLPPTHTNNKPLQHLPHHWIPVPHTQRHLRHLPPQMTLNSLFLGGRRQGWLPRFASEALVLVAVRSHHHPPGDRSPPSSCLTVHLCVMVTRPRAAQGGVFSLHTHRDALSKGHFPPGDQRSGSGKQ